MNTGRTMRRFHEAEVGQAGSEAAANCARLPYIHACRVRRERARWVVVVQPNESASERASAGTASSTLRHSLDTHSYHIYVFMYTHFEVLEQALQSGFLLYYTAPLFFERYLLRARGERVSHARRSSERDRTDHGQTAVRRSDVMTLDRCEMSHSALSARRSCGRRGRSRECIALTSHTFIHHAAHRLDLSRVARPRVLAEAKAWSELFTSRRSSAYSFIVHSAQI